MAQQSLHPALEGARTFKGGAVRVKNGCVGELGMPAAIVGDALVYPDSREATVTSGAGLGRMFDGLFDQYCTYQTKEGRHG